MADLALSPVAVALYGVLNVGSLTTLATGGVYDDIPQSVTFPFVLVEVQERDVRGFGLGGLPECTVRLRVYSTYQGWKEAQSILSQAITLLKDVALTVNGYRMCGHVFYDESVPIPDSEINGVKCKELVANFRVYVEEA